MTAQCQTLIIGGRVVDPRNGINDVLTVGITDGRIVHIGAEPIPAERSIDAEGLIVSPGFIDLHSHAQNRIGHLLQAHDGVTTSLELECGATPLLHSLEAAEREGRSLNFGYSASWLLARMIVMEDMGPSEVAKLPTLPLDSFGALQASQNWQKPADADQVDAIVELVADQLNDGAIGIGVLLGYAPAVDESELQTLAEMAVRRNAPLFVHVRYGANVADHAAYESVKELVELSERTGVQIHICHLASSNAGGGHEPSRLLQAAIERGLPITTESYPFEFASTVIGADFLSPQILEASGTPASTITYLPKNEKVSSYSRLAELRAQDPGGLCLIQYYGPDRPAGVDELISTLSFPDAAFASDAMPLTAVKGPDAPPCFPTSLPVPADFAVHPRSSSCFIRALTWLHRDTGLMSLDEVISRSSVIPARILASAAPIFESKGHLGVGADADIVIFDLATAEPRTEPVPVGTAQGVVHLFINGEQLIEHGRSHAMAPGRPVFARTWAVRQGETE
jgi:N-acyl-D-aspartate/D-glutamate deacylase